MDIAKAFDTVDRSFSFRIMEAAGCGRPMPHGWVMRNDPCGRPMQRLRWVQLLLSDTRAYTVVNGHVTKSGKLVSVRAALCLPFSTSSWRRLWHASLGSAMSWASRWSIRSMLAFTMQAIRRSFCRPCSRSWCRAWLCALICLILRLGNASKLLSPLWCLLPPCHPLLLLRWLVWAPSRLWHPRSAWASPSPQLLPSSSSLLGERVAQAMAPACSGAPAPAQCSLGHPPRFCGVAVLQAAGVQQPA
jgi:hypothetical protein